MAKCLDDRDLLADAEAAATLVHRRTHRRGQATRRHGRQRRRDLGAASAASRYPDRRSCSAAPSDAASIFWRNSRARAEGQAAAGSDKGSGAKPGAGERHVARRRGLCLCASVLGGGDRPRGFRRRPRRNALRSKIRATTPTRHNWPDLRGRGRAACGPASGATARPASVWRGSPPQRCGGKAEADRRVAGDGYPQRRRRRRASVAGAGRYAVLRHARQYRIFLRGGAARSIATIFARLPRGGYQAVLQRAAATGDYRWNSGKRQFNLGLFRGLSGVGYTLLRQASTLDSGTLAERADLGIAVRRRTHCCLRRCTSRDQHRFEHVEGLHLHPTFGRRVGRYIDDLARIHLLLLAVDVQRDALIVRRTDQADRQTAVADDQTFDWADVVGVLRRHDGARAPPAPCRA